MHPITFFSFIDYINFVPKCHFPFKFPSFFIFLFGRTYYKEVYYKKKNKKSMDKKLDTSSTLRYVTKITFAHVWDVTSRNYRLTLPFFKFTLTEADVKFGLVKFCYIFFILYAIYDILLKTVKNNIVACFCNAFYTNLSLWNTTRHHLTCVVLSHSTSGGDISYLFYICCLRMK